MIDKKTHRGVESKRSDPSIHKKRKNMIDILIDKICLIMLSLERIHVKMTAFDAAIVIFAVAVIFALYRYVGKFFT